MSPVLELQYQMEERMRLRNRVATSYGQLTSLISTMAADTLSTPENVRQLKTELSELYQDDAFLSCKSMGEILRTSLHMLEKYPVRKRVKAKI